MYAIILIVSENTVTRKELSGFGGLVRQRRQELKLSMDDLARLLSKSAAYIQLVETKKRGVELTEVSRWASVLQYDARSLLKSYINSHYPTVFEVLFPGEQPEVVNERPQDAIRDVATRLHSLPRDIRTGIEATILAVYDRLNSDANR